MSVRNRIVFGFSALALLVLVVLLGDIIWYRINNVVLRLAVTTLLLLALASAIQVLYLMLIHRYRVDI
jgi:ABC-type multidrug transport system permease subunit